MPQKRFCADPWSVYNDARINRDKANFFDIGKWPFLGLADNHEY